jgi:hypothetical protein
MVKNYNNNNNNNNNIAANKSVGLQAGPHSVTNGSDFDTPLRFTSSEWIFHGAQLPKGYQSTASVELKFYLNGAEIKPDTVFWTILDVKNEARAWNRGTAALNGLAWGDSRVCVNTKWGDTPIIGGRSIATSTGTVKLTDVVGERIVTLKAGTTVNGVPFSETIDVSFGKGPLSVFAKPPSSGGLPWATANSIAIINHKNNFTADSTTFPAATFCGGTVHVGSSDITIGGRGPESYTADFIPGIISGHWSYEDTVPWNYEDNCTNNYYSITSKLPSIAQLVAVSHYDGGFHGKVDRKGAANAAGWPSGNFWTGEVFFSKGGYFHAIYVGLASGGTKSDFVTRATYFVACVP